MRIYKCNIFYSMLLAYSYCFLLLALADNLNLADMHRQQNLKKSKRCLGVGQCMICRIARIPFLITISSVILLQKYYHPLEKSTHAALTSPLVRAMPGRVRTNFREAQLLSDRRENLLGYNNFAATVGKIKAVVLECLRRDRLLPMHYQSHSHPIMLRHAFLKRRTVPPPRPLLAKEYASESTDEDQNSEPRREAVACRGNETASMRRLTRNLSSMVRRFEDQNDFHTSFVLEILNYASKHGVEDLHPHEQAWKRELEENSISEIFRVNKKHVGAERLQTNPDPPSKKLQIHENYGFQPRQKISNQEYKPERKKVASPNFARPMKENIPQRIQTDYDCEVIKKGKKSSVSGKKDLEKGRKFLGSGSRKKDKLGSVAKSRVK